MARVVGEASIEPAEYFFEGLGRQNMAFQHAVAELIDNAIAASEAPFTVDVYLDSLNSAEVTITVVDRGTGMSLDALKTRALTPGALPQSTHRLNEHGFGLKNALCSLTMNRSEFEILTRDSEAVSSGRFYRVKGPFKVPMEIEEENAPAWPEIGSQSTGTIVSATTTLTYVQTVQEKRGPRARMLGTLTRDLMEHLGVLYRGYLTTIDPRSGLPMGQINVHQGGETKRVPGLPIPMNVPQREDIPFTAGGTNYTCRYTHGVLDEVVRAERDFQIYYQGTIPTQGIDVTVGLRTIARHQFNEIWDLARHGSYNPFIGELVIPSEVPRTYLRTVNNKSNYDYGDPIWEQIFQQLRRDYTPAQEVRVQSERALREKLADNLRIYSNDTIIEKYSVWGGVGVEIDIYRENPNTGEITIYELKVGRAQPLNLYQLKMYWDGLTLAGKQPAKAVLVVSDYESTHQGMADELNTEFRDITGGQYNFELKKHPDLNLP